MNNYSYSVDNITIAPVTIEQVTIAKPVGGTTISSTATAQLSQEDSILSWYLIVVAIVGGFLNLLVVVMFFASKHGRRMTNFFVLHGALLDIAKCGYCIPFAQSLRSQSAPSNCNMLGASFVVLISVSTFNIIAISTSEAYAFRDAFGDDEQGSICCLLFGMCALYVGTIIVHLGPTIIGGAFTYNSKVGNCMYTMTDDMKSYIVYVMWVCINSLALLGSFYYLFLLHRQIGYNKPHRIATLVRQAVMISKDKAPRGNLLKSLVATSLSRVQVLFIVCTLMILCWYPLFVLNIADPRYHQSPKLYKVLWVLGYSNGAINPAMYLLFDRSLGLCYSVFCCSKCRDPIQSGTTPLMNTPGPSFNSQVQMYQRIGCRLCREGHSHGNLCNGAFGNGGLVRDPSSFCEYADLHHLGL